MGSVMYNVYIAIQVIGILVILFALALLVNGKSTREQKLMSCFVGASLIQNVAYLLELTSGTMEAALVATKMEYLGSCFIVLFYCWFMFEYCMAKSPGNFLKFLAWMDFLVLLLVFTCDRHTLYYRKIEWIEDGALHPYLRVTYGVGFGLFLLFSCIIPYGASIYVLVNTLLTKSRQAAGRKYLEFIVLSLFPIMALVSYIWKLSVDFDPTPVMLGFTLAGTVILIWSRKNYDFNRMAAEVVLNSMDDGVIMLDENRRIVSYNGVAAEIFTELSFQTVGDSIDDMEDFPEDVLNENIRRKFSLNGRYYESHVKRVTGGDGRNQGYVILVLDMTETKNYLEEIKEVSEQAERANVAKSEFLANMSHEIRTPMNAIMGLSEIIMTESRGRKIYGYACDIKSAAGNLLTIINDILDLSKVEAGKMELVPEEYYIKGIVGEVMNMMAVVAVQRGLELKCEYDEKLPCQYEGDAGRIKQMLINIMNNAVKFTREGHVRLAVSGKDCGREGYLNLVFRVEDTGCGIEPENLEKIFEDFRQLNSKKNREVEGTGLGLSITKRLVQLMGGQIEVESVYGHGTAFTISIPQKIVDGRTIAEVPEAPVRAAERMETFVVENYKALVVDDNLINREVALGFLKSYGFELSEAESGPQAIEMVKKTRFNLIFMDHMMPGMDGMEATRIIREECGENGSAPVIIALTANAMEGVRETFLQNGFQDFIAKPMERKTLNEILSKWIPSSLRQVQAPKPAEGEDGPELSFDSISIPGIDIEEAKKHHSGEAQDYLELLRLYSLDGRRKLPYLSQLAESEDCLNYRIEVHGLKSASANVGAMELSAQAREHEEMANREDTDYIHLHLPELLECYDNLLKEIDIFLDKRENIIQGQETLEMSIDREALLREVKSALDSLENFRSRDCAGKVDALLKYRLDSETQSRLKAVKEQLKMYEDDAAEQLLRDLTEWINKEDEQ